ncbi:YgdI/YgdR family lipoprotein [Fulvivirga maritima]|uniref:YgdI/YgdR family lipoprotein n=1 Tax=Fulvivirga maritima TaxID=2904247 RepID=UPI001F2B69FD|nr:YgdI/YgdR family lipoprotein [Fulvivirga maritima]UII25753.1 YgdI/YgdR family lipoprotein [Fulvivirga maritima]
MRILKIISFAALLIGFFSLSACSDPYEEIHKKELPTEPEGVGSEPHGERD